MCQIQVSSSISATSQRVKVGQVISTVAQEMEIFLPWKKFVLPVASSISANCNKKIKK
jgi:hypothetical protein